MPAESKSEEVGDVAKAAVDSLNLTPQGGAVLASVKRKTPSLPEGKDPPALVISVGEEGETEYLTASLKRKKFPVAITIVTGGGQKMGDDPIVRKWRQQIEQKLEAKATWAGLAGFSRADITNKAPFDTAALSKDFNYATVVCVVEVIEGWT